MVWQDQFITYQFNQIVFLLIDFDQLFFSTLKGIHYYSFVVPSNIASSSSFLQIIDWEIARSCEMILR